MNFPPLNRKTFLHRLLLVPGLTLTAASAVAQTEKTATSGEFDVRAFGAKGDGVTFDTAAIQAAIDACHRANGGRVLLQGGTFLSRTIQLKSNVTLFIEAGAVLLGTPNLEDYSEIKPAYLSYTYSHRAFLYAEGTDNVSILGKGAIDLRGRDFPPQPLPGKGPPGTMEWGQSPFAVRLIQCRNLTVRDITIRNCPMAALRIVAGENVLVDGVVIDNRVRISCDGIEIVSSREVCISNCRVDSWDDGICLKSSSLDACRNITITNCTVRSLCNALKMGTESSGGFENITISNCTVEGSEMAGWRSINGLALMIVDGGTMNQINVSNVVMRGVRTAIFVRLANRARRFSPDTPKPDIGVLKNVRISHLQAEVLDAEYCCSISGEPGHPVENIVLDDIQIRFPGGGTREGAARVVPEKPTQYPESLMFGPLPAYGFFCRHVRGLTLRHVTLQLVTADLRPALVAEDVEDLELTGLRAANAGAEPLVRLHQVRGALLQNCRPEAETFVSLAGEQSADVALLSNDLRRTRHSVVKAGTFTGPIVEVGNLPPTP